MRGDSVGGVLETASRVWGGLGGVVVLVSEGWSDSGMVLEFLDLFG